MSKRKKICVNRGGNMPVLHILRKDGKTLCGIDSIASMNYDRMSDADKEWLCSSCKKAYDSYVNKTGFFPNKTK